MGVRPRPATIAIAIAAVVLGAIAFAYLVVACQSLPGFLPGLLGPVAGDTHPRTRVGIGFLCLAALAGVASLLAARHLDRS